MTDTVLDTSLTDAALVMNGTVTGVIDAPPLRSGSSNTAIDHDWFWVSLSAGQTYTFGGAITSGVSSDYLGTAAMDLRSPTTGALIASTANANDGDSVAPTFTYTPSISGTYFLAISAGASYLTSSSNFHYSISVLQNNTSPGAGVVDPFVPYSDANASAPTVNDVIAAARQYVGRQWAWENCTGLVWAVGTEVDPTGGGFYESIHDVTLGGNAIPSIIPDPDAGYVTPAANTTSGHWQTVQVANWNNYVRPGDIVRIPRNVISAGDPGHSFVVTSGSVGNWTVIDNTDPNHKTGLVNSDAPVVITEHTLNNPGNTLYGEILNASVAEVSRLISTAPGVSFAVSSQTGAEGSDLTFRISIQNPNYPSVQDYRIYYNTTDATASAGSDYTGIVNQVAVDFTASSAQFIDVTVHTLSDNNPNEGSETFNFNIYDYTHSLLSSAQGTITDVATPQRTVPRDFNGDRTSDLLWRNSSNGDLYDWSMSGGHLGTSSYLGLLPASQWTVLSSGDFNGDYTSDLLWRNSSTGALYDWSMSGGRLGTSTYLSMLPASQWTLISSGDFNGDTTSDLLWRNNSTGDLYDWSMSGGHVGTSTYLGALPASQWTLLSSDDFTGDHTSDLLWRNNSTGDLYEWSMSGGHIGTSNYLGFLSPAQWSLVASGDFSGDGTSDLLWRNNSTGDLYEWTMSGGRVSTSNYLGALPASQWTLLSSGNFNGDATADLLWRNNSSGDLYDWSMSGGHIGTSTYLGFLSPSQWSLMSSDDFSGEGTSDLLWRNNSTGDLYDWSMSGGHLGTSTYLGALPASQWSLAA